jgi:dephospho-CoA kinase
MKSMEELKRRDEREKGWGLDKAIEKADINSDNTGTIEKFKERMEQLLGNL